MCRATMRSVTNSCCAIASSTRVAHQGELPSLMVGQMLEARRVFPLRRALSNAVKRSYVRSRPAPTRLEGLAVSTRPGRGTTVPAEFGLSATGSSRRS